MNKILFLLALMPPSFALAVDEIRPTINEWDVPWENTRPRDPCVGPDGLVWFVGQQGDYVASLNPDSGEFQQFPLDKGAGPHNVVVGEDGSIWYAGNRDRHIGRLEPDSGDVHKVPMPDEDARDPHTLTFDDQGNIWFTVQAGNFVGRLNRNGEEVDLVPVPTQRARPYGIKIHGEDVWVALFGTNKLAHVDANSLELQEISLPRMEARPRRLEIAPDGSVWYVDYAGGKLGRYDPDSGEFDEWDSPGGSGSRPYGMAMDHQGRLWFVETGLQPNRFVGFDPAQEEFYAPTEIESGGGTVRHMSFDPERRVIWFGTDANTIGSATVPE